MFPFKKQTIFSREDMHMQREGAAEGGLLCVWGAPGTGKTTLACKIAKYISEKRQNVILLLCDATAPMVPCIVSPSELEVEKSLHSIYASHNISEALVKYNMITLKRNGRISILGVLKGENEMDHATCTPEQATQLLFCLREIAPFLIVDCTSYLSGDVLSSIALRDADNVLRLVSCDLKSISYLSSQLPLFQRSGFEFDNHYKVASNVKPHHNEEQMSTALGRLAFSVPHSPEVEEQYLQGNLLSELTMKNSRAFRKEVQKITREVFNL